MIKLVSVVTESEIFLGHFCLVSMYQVLHYLLYFINLFKVVWSLEMGTLQMFLFCKDLFVSLFKFHNWKTAGYQYDDLHVNCTPVSISSNKKL